MSDTQRQDMTEDEKRASYNMTPEDRARLSTQIRARLKNGNATGFWETFRLTRDDVRYGLLWSEEDPAAAEAAMAEVKERKRQAESRRNAAQRLGAEIDRVMRELRDEDTRKLKAKAEKIARQRLGLS